MNIQSTTSDFSNAREIVRVLQAEGHIAYLAGGCVRDRLLNREPKDFDVVTSAYPEEVLSLFEKSYQVGAHFPIVLVKIGEQTSTIEVATFRGEDAEISSSREDALRRDFTLNAIFWDPINDLIIDEVGGRTDIEHRILRACGCPEHRFSADPLRLLRAIRLVVDLELSFAEETWDGIISCCTLLSQVSAERISAELTKIWRCSNKLRAFDLLVESGLMGELIPEVMALKGCQQPPEFHPEGDVFVHTRNVLQNLPAKADLSLVWAALLHDIAKPLTAKIDEDTGRIRFLGHAKLGGEMVTRILSRLKYSNDLISTVSSIVSQHMVFYSVRGMKNSRLRRLMAEPDYPILLELHRADSLGGKGDLSRYNFMLEKAAEFESAPLIPDPLLNGRDLLKLGVQPGAQIGNYLKRIQTLQLDGVLTSRKEALDWLSRALEAD